MSKVIKNERIVEDHWQVVKLAEGQTPETLDLTGEVLIVPLAVWLARKDEIITRSKPIGVWLDGNEGPEAIAGDLEHFALIAVN